MREVLEKSQKKLKDFIRRKTRRCNGKSSACIIEDVMLEKVQKFHFHAEPQRTQSFMRMFFLRDLRVSA